MLRRSRHAVSLAAALLLLAAPARAVTIFDGPSLAFSKPSGGDLGDPANRDLIVPGVVELTRGFVGGIFNYAQEAQYAFPAAGSPSPLDTEWAFAFNNPTATLRASNHAALTFAPWAEAHGFNPPGTVGQDAVLHIVSEDIYIDIRFDAWGVGPVSAGSFAYTRSTAPVPEPGTALLLCALALGIARRRSARSRAV